MELTHGVWVSNYCATLPSSESLRADALLQFPYTVRSPDEEHPAGCSVRNFRSLQVFH